MKAIIITAIICVTIVVLYWLGLKDKEKKKRYNAIPVIILKDRNELHFVPIGKTFDRWCFGRTYKFLGSETLFHGGYPVKEHHSEQK